MDSNYTRTDRASVDAQLAECNEMIDTLNDADEMIVRFWDTIRAAVKMLDQAKVPHTFDTIPDEAGTVLETVQGLRAVSFWVMSERDSLIYKANHPQQED